MARRNNKGVTKRAFNVYGKRASVFASVCLLNLSMKRPVSAPARGRVDGFKNRRD